MVADIAKLSVGREEYYTRELATDHEQYLSGHGESPGRWYGAGATGLGLQGEASAAGFQAMFEGRDPTTGELLGRPHGRNAVPAFDVVLRPTKSVSILYGLGGPVTGRAVLAAHHAGVAEATAYLDTHIGTRRGHGGYEHVSGQGLLAVGFDHRTSREGDPLVHTHLVVANRVQGPDGRWTALDGRDLYRHRLAADAIYRATYQRELGRTLGVEWTVADRHGNRELEGMSEDLVRLFSKRTDQIDLEVERLQAEGRERTPRLVKWAVQATRKPKQHEGPDTLYGRWWTEAAERGLDPDTVVRQVIGRTRSQDLVVSERTVAAVFDRLACPDGLTATASTFARQDVLAAVGGQLAGATRAELEGLADRFLAEQAVSVVAERALEERRWSTPELLATEQRLVEAAVGRAGDQTAVVSHEAVRAALAAHPSAGEDQQGMVRDVCQGGAGVALVVGRAGTGKTFALGAARHAWQLDGYRPLATAPTGIATVSLEAEGFEEVATCDRLLADLDRGRERLDGRTVLVVDEAGMLGSRKLTRLLDHAQRAGAKVVLVGDDRQLAAIDAGGGFRALRLRLGASELTRNRRQQQAWEREALELVRSGLVEEAVAAYRVHDRVVCAESKPAATLALLQDWWAAWQQAEQNPSEDVVLLAYRRSEVDRLNSACQQLLAARDRHSDQRLQVEDLELAVGDRVVCGKNAIGQLGVANGTRGTITALDPDARTLTIRLEGKEPREVTLPAWYLDGRGRGERNRRVELAYATTGHRAQGLTRWRALVRLTGHENLNWLYVQLSRARHETTLYPVVGPEPQGPAELDLPDREVGDGYDQLAQALARAGDQTLASTPPAAWTCGGCRSPSCGPNATGSAGCWTRPRGTAAGSCSGRPPAEPRQMKPWSSSPPPATLSGRGGGCFAGRGGPSHPRPIGPQPGWPASRPTGPTTLSSRCASSSSAGPAGWRPTPTSAPPTARSSASWPGNAAPPASLPSSSSPATSAGTSARCPRAPGGGGSGARPPPPSRTTAAATRSATPSRRWASCPANRPSGPPGSRPARRSTEPKAASPAPAATASPSAARHPNQPPSIVASPTSHQPTPAQRSHDAGQVRSGPPASTTRRPPFHRPSPTPTPMAAGPPATTPNRACPSGRSATPTWPPCSPTSTNTTTARIQATT